MRWTQKRIKDIKKQGGLSAKEYKKKTKQERSC